MVSLVLQLLMQKLFVLVDNDTSGVGIHLNENLDHEFSHIDLEADNAAFAGAVVSTIFSPIIGAGSIGALSASGTDYNSYMCM